MFEVINIGSDIKVCYVFNGKKIQFMIDNAITNKIKNELHPEKLFRILNGYLDYKGPEFKATLYDILEKSSDILFSNATSINIDPMPVYAVHNVLDLFSIEDVTSYLKNNNVISIPSVLGETYDTSRDLNENGSREQTFLVEDYYQLIALVTILKTVLGVIGEYATLRSSKLPSNFKDSILLNFLSSHDIYDTPPMVKLYSYVEKLVNIVSLTPEEFSKRIIEKNVSREDMSTYVLASAIFQRLIYANEIDEVNEKNLITKLYNIVTSSIQLKPISSSSNLRIKKTYSIGTDSAYESGESILETFRIATPIAIGMIEEFKYVYSQPYVMAKHLGVKNKTLLDMVLKDFTMFDTLHFPKESVTIMSWILKEIIDPRASRYVDLDNILNGLAVAFVWLIEHGHTEIAILLSSYEIILDKDSFSYSSGHKNKLSNEIKNTLDEIYPYQKAVISKKDVKNVNFIIPTITKITIGVSRYMLRSMLSMNTLKELKIDRVDTSIPDDFKNMLGRLIIEISTL